MNDLSITLRRQAVANIRNNLQSRVLKVLIDSTEHVFNRQDAQLIYSELRALSREYDLYDPGIQDRLLDLTEQLENIVHSPRRVVLENWQP